MQEDGRLKITDGDSYVLMVKGEKGWQRQFGAATIRTASPHYADQAPLLAKRELKLVWFEEADIFQHLDSEYIHRQEDTR